MTNEQRGVIWTVCALFILHGVLQVIHKIWEATGR